MEDFADTQNCLGKALMKIDAHVSVSGVREPWLQQLHSLFESIYKISLSLGSEYLNLSSSLSQTMSRQFKDLSKEVTRKLTMTVQNIQSSIDDINRDRNAFTKKYGKYQKVARKCEALIEDMSREVGASTSEDRVHEMMSKVNRSGRSYQLTSLVVDVDAEGPYGESGQALQGLLGSRETAPGGGQRSQSQERQYLRSSPGGY